VSKAPLISFGTSGWRGVIADDFTFQGVRAVTQAIAEHILAEGSWQQGLVVGYDTRFLSRAFARQVAEVLAGNGIPIFFCVAETPTPTIAYEIIRRQAAGGVNITASHNPPEYNGLKLSGPSGGPALPEVTKAIEARANELLACDEVKHLEFALAEEKGLLHPIDPKQAYLQRLQELIDFKAIRRAGLKVAVDALHGAGRGYVDKALRETGCSVLSLRRSRDPSFGGKSPDPSQENLRRLGREVRRRQLHLGLATDGDADRFGVVDADGAFIQPNFVIALLLKHLMRARRLSGAVARSVATSHLLDAVAKRYGLEVIETPVGFKYIGDLIAQGRLVLGGEESAGLSIQGHIPEKDGILACLLVAEMVAINGLRSLASLLEELYTEVGRRVVTERLNLHLSPEERAKLEVTLRNPPTRVAGKTVKEVKAIDGIKLILEDGSWLLVRPSGTEPLVRLYGEAASQGELEVLLAAGLRLVRDK